MSNFLSFNNIVRTAMMPVFGATGAVTGEYCGELIDSVFNCDVADYYILRISAVFGCAITATIGALIKLYWEKSEHEKKRQEILDLVD